MMVWPWSGQPVLTFGKRPYAKFTLYRITSPVAIRQSMNTSLEIDPFAYVNPVDGAFSFQRINVQKVIRLLMDIDVGKATGFNKFQTGF